MILTYFKRGKGQKLRRSRSQIVHKGQIKPKADWRAMDSPKKRTNEFVEISSFKYFRTVKKKKQIGFFGFWENLWPAKLLTVLSDL